MAAPSDFVINQGFSGVEFGVIERAYHELYREVKGTNRDKNISTTLLIITAIILGEHNFINYLKPVLRISHVREKLQELIRPNDDIGMLVMQSSYVWIYRITKNRFPMYEARDVIPGNLLQFFLGKLRRMMINKSPSGIVPLPSDKNSSCNLNDRPTLTDLLISLHLSPDDINKVAEYYVEKNDVEDIKLIEYLLFLSMNKLLKDGTCLKTYEDFNQAYSLGTEELYLWLYFWISHTFPGSTEIGNNQGKYMASVIPSALKEVYDLLTYLNRERDVVIRVRSVR